MKTKTAILIWFIAIIILAVPAYFMQGCVAVHKKTTVTVFVSETELNLNLDAELDGGGDKGNE